MVRAGSGWSERRRRVRLLRGKRRLSSSFQIASFPRRSDSRSRNACSSAAHRRSQSGSALRWCSVARLRLPRPGPKLRGVVLVRLVRKAAVNSAGIAAATAAAIAAVANRVATAAAIAVATAEDADAKVLEFFFPQERPGGRCTPPGHFFFLDRFGQLSFPDGDAHRLRELDADVVFRSLARDMPHRGERGDL
jgi:hypothetical protein